MFVAFTSVGSFDPRYITDSKLEQLENAKEPTEFTEDGMVIDVRFLQLEKALVSIDVIFDVIFTVFKLKHPENVNALI